MQMINYSKLFRADNYLHACKSCGVFSRMRSAITHIIRGKCKYVIR